MKNYCKGCYSYEEEESYAMVDCEISKLNRTGKCPCTDCLVKVMCKMGCDTFEEYYSKILKMINAGEVLR